MPHFRGLIELRVLILIEIGLVLRSIQADRTFSSIRGLVHINQKCIQLSLFSFSSRLVLIDKVSFNLSFLCLF